MHPQEWPEDLDYTGKRVVVIGSGATAMTLVPAMADDAAHITMLQRSPTYVVSRPDQPTPSPTGCARCCPTALAYDMTRRKNMTLQQLMYKRMRSQPEKVEGAAAQAWCAPSWATTTTSTPTSRRRYYPWDQRLCLVPNSDLFEAIKSGKASVVTDTIDTFTETGITLASGDATRRRHRRHRDRSATW